METMIKLLISGYVIGLACMGYLFLRSCHFRFGKDTNGHMITITRELGVNWFGIMLFSMIVSYVWCMIGALIHFVLGSSLQFLQFSLLFALTGSVAIYSLKTGRKTDKIAINGIVVIGSGIMFAGLF